MIERPERPRPFLTRLWSAALAAAVLLLPAAASACATCFGKSDDPMARGMNAGIFTLLLCILSVLAAISVFFFYILRRAARMAAAAQAGSAAASPAPTLSQPTS